MRIVQIFMLGCLFVAGFAAPAFAKMEGEAWRKMKEKFEGSLNDYSRRMEVLEMMGEANCKAAVQAMCEAYPQFWTNRQTGELKKEPNPADMSYLMKFAEVMAKYDDPEAIQEMIKQLEKGEWQVQALVAEAFGLGKQPEGLPKLHELLASKKAFRTPLLRALEAIEGYADPASIEPLTKFATEKQSWWETYLAATLALEKIGKWQCIPGLIECMRNGSERVKHAVQKALVDLTGENFNLSAQAWLKWYTDNKARIDDGTIVKGQKKWEAVEADPGGGSYHGIPLKSDRVIFIIDRSGSMAEPYKEKGAGKVVSGENGGNDEHRGKGSIKLEVVQNELVRTIENLPVNIKFTVIAFSDNVDVWKTDLVDASERNKRDAKAWVLALTPTGQTHSYSALKMGFDIARGQEVNPAIKQPAGGPKKVVSGQLADTIFFLSDGVPYGDVVDEPNEILKEVAAWNKHLHLRINTISIDFQSDTQFMERLARQNAGTHVSL